MRWRNLAGDVTKNKALDVAMIAVDFWTDFINENGIQSQDIILILVGDEQIDSVTLKYLPVMLVEKKKRKCFVVSCNRDERFIRDNLAIDAFIKHVPKENIDSLRLIPSVYRLLDNIYFNSFVDVEDVDGFKLCGLKRITKENVIATGVLNLTYTPDDMHIDSALNQRRSLDILNEKEVKTVLDKSNIENMKEELTRKITLGSETYERLVDAYGDAKLLITPFPGSGDIYLICMYLKDYLEREHIDSYVLVVIGKGLQKVANLFDVNSVVITKEEMDGLFYFGRLSGLWGDHFRVFDNNMYQRRTNWIQGLNGTDYNTMLQRVVFGAKQRITERTHYMESADDILRTLKGHQEKTVLIAPYANTLVPLPSDFWPKLVKRLQEKGYKVLTNVASDSDVAIDGTEPIFVPYSKLVSFVDNIGAFIGLRSGMCDIMSLTKGKMAVIYRGRMYSGVTSKDFFGLSNMGLKEDNILEIDYGEYVEKDDFMAIHNYIISFVEK